MASPWPVVYIHTFRFSAYSFSTGELPLHYFKASSRVFIIYIDMPGLRDISKLSLLASKFLKPLTNSRAEFSLMTRIYRIILLIALARAPSAWYNLRLRLRRLSYLTQARARLRISADLYSLSFRAFVVSFILMHRAASDIHAQPAPVPFSSRPAEDTPIRHDTRRSSLNTLQSKVLQILVLPLTFYEFMIACLKIRSIW